MSDLIKRSEVWQALHNIGGCGADPDSWADGWDKAIDAAIEAVEKLPAACSDEIITAILEENIKAHGTEVETTVAMEELAELIQAVSKVKRYGFVGKYKDNLIEELADVDIVITELMMLFDVSTEEFYSVIDRKVQRIKKRLKERI